MPSLRGLVDRFRSLPRKARVGLLAGAAFALGTGSLLIGTPSLVRSMVRERAEERGLSVSVGRVGIGFDKLRLGAVQVADQKLPGCTAEFDSIEVGLGIFGERRIRVDGGRARLLGSEQVLRERLESLRGARAQAPQQQAEAKSLGVAVSGVDVAWREGPAAGRAVDGWGLRVERRDSAALRLAWDLLRVRAGRLSADLESGEALLSESAVRRLERIEIAKVNVRADLNDPAVVPAPAATGAPASAPPGASTTSPSLPALLAGLGPALGRVLGERFQAKVVALRAEATHGGERVRIGPSGAELGREGEALRLSIVPHPAAAAAGTPLTIRARAPLGPGALELELSGGPLSLAALGVQEGDFGLFGTERARLEAELRLVLSPSGELDVNSHGRLEHATLRRPALSSSEISGIELGWRGAGSGRLDGSKIVLRDAELSIGEVRAQLSGEIERDAERLTVRGQAALPAVACSSLRSALPDGLAPLLAGVKLDGTFSLSAAVDYDSKKPSATKTKLELSNRCRVSEVPPAISPKRFRSAWLREVKGADGLPMAIESGPGSPDWTPYEEISPHLETAVIVSEDGGFFRHRGFDARAMESALRDNLIARRYLRGASTISMQLAKNLYLGSEKTIGRKIQEAVLVVLLEQELAKHELMELYLNVIEFGPGIYGVKRAARHYFDEEPAELSLAQALYLSSILPNPDSSHFRADGSLSERWTAYLRKLMQIAHRIGRITEEELTAGLREEIRFREPSAQAAEHSESGGTGGGFGDDAPPSELGRSARSLEQTATP
jgi:hypothetical protein